MASSLERIRIRIPSLAPFSLGTVLRCPGVPCESAYRGCHASSLRAEANTASCRAFGLCAGSPLEDEAVKTGKTSVRTALVCVALHLLLPSASATAQVRGVYPLGMSATN